MKRKYTVLIAVVVMFVVGFLGTTFASAQEEPTKTLLGDYLKSKDIDVSVGGTLDFWDKYVWRGQYLDRDAVLQPGVSISAKGFTVGYWGSFDMENQDALASDESDYYLSYTYNWEALSFTAGHTWYDFPEANTSSKEYFFSIGLDTFLSPTLFFAHDYEDGKDLNTDGDGNYLSLALSHSITLNEEYGVSLDLGLTAGYVDGQWLAGEGTHLTPTIGLSVPLTPNMTVTPTIGYNAPFGDLKKDSIGNQDPKLFGGVKVAASF